MGCTTLQIKFYLTQIYSHSEKKFSYFKRIFRWNLSIINEMSGNGVGDEILCYYITFISKSEI